MSVDLLLVDDEEGVMQTVEVTARIAARENDLPLLDIVKFTRGVAALEYLRAHADDLPMGYLVDMRIPYGTEELAAPQRIFEFLKERDATQYFRFFTGHLSPHDKKVMAATGARVLLKGRMDDTLENYLVELAKAKRETRSRLASRYL